MHKIGTEKNILQKGKGLAPEHTGTWKENLSPSSVSPEPLLTRLNILPAGEGKNI